VKFFIFSILPSDLPMKYTTSFPIVAPADNVRIAISKSSPLRRARIEGAITTRYGIVEYGIALDTSASRNSPRDS